MMMMMMMIATLTTGCSQQHQGHRQIQCLDMRQ